MLYSSEKNINTHIVSEFYIYWRFYPVFNNIFFQQIFFFNSHNQDATFELLKTPLGAQMNILY